MRKSLKIKRSTWVHNTTESSEEVSDLCVSQGLVGTLHGCYRQWQPLQLPELPAQVIIRLNHLQTLLLSCSAHLGDKKKSTQACVDEATRLPNFTCVAQSLLWNTSLLILMTSSSCPPTSLTHDSGISAWLKLDKITNKMRM